MTGRLKSTTDGQTLVLTLSNPEFKNALGPEMYAAGIEALNAAENNADIRSVVITGEGGVFCAGGQLQRLLANRLEEPEVQAQNIESLHNWIDAIRTYPKPVLAAVDGAASGAGFSLALACDLIVAASNTVFVMSYSTVALSPDGGASWVLGAPFHVRLPVNCCCAVSEFRPRGCMSLESSIASVVRATLSLRHLVWPHGSTPWHRTR